MQFTGLHLAIFVLSAIIPALIVAVVFMLRLEAIRVTIVTITHKCEQALLDVTVVKNSAINTDAAIEKLNISIGEINGSIHGVRAMSQNLEESIKSLSNKWNSRERVERLREKKERKEEEESDVTPIPGADDPNQLDLFPPVPVPLNDQKPRTLPFGYFTGGNGPKRR